MMFLFKAAIASAFLYWLISSGRLELSHLRNIPWVPRTVGLVMLGVGVVCLGFLLLSWRLCLMVRDVGIVLSLRSAFALTSIGAFSGAILPGVVGGDLVKVVYLCRGEASTRRTVATVAVLCDRAVGLIALFLLGAIASGAAAVSGSLPFLSPVLLVAPLMVLAAAAAVAIFAGRHHLGSWAIRWFERYIPARIRFGASVGDHYLRRPRLLASCLALSLTNHILVCGTFLIASILLGGVEVSLLQQLLLNPLAIAVNLISLTPGGVGITEGAFSYLYDAAGCPLGAAIGILGRAIQYVAFAAAGFPSMILRGRGKVAASSTSA